MGLVKTWVDWLLHHYLLAMTFLPVLFLVAENQDAGILSDFLKTKLASYLSFNFRGMNRNNDQSTFSISSQRSRPFRSPHVSCNFLLDNALEFLKEPITTTQFVLPRRFQHLSPDENRGIRKSSCKSLYIYKYMTLTPCLLHLQFTYICLAPLERSLKYTHALSWSLIIKCVSDGSRICIVYTYIYIHTYCRIHALNILTKTY